MTYPTLVQVAEHQHACRYATANPRASSPICDKIYVSDSGLQNSNLQSVISPIQSNVIIEINGLQENRTSRGTLHGTCFLHAEVHLPGNKLRHVDFQAGERVRSRSFDGPALGTDSRTQPHLVVRDLHHFAVVDRLQSRQPQETDASFSFD